MTRASRSTAAEIRAADPGDDFALGWVRDRVGAEELREIVVLAVKDAPTDASGQPAAAFTSRFRVVVERFGGYPRQSDDMVPYAIWGLTRTSAHDARLAGQAALDVVAECGASGSALRCGLYQGPVAVAAEPGWPTQGPLPADLTQVVNAAVLTAGRAPWSSVIAPVGVARLAGESFFIEPFSTSAATGGQPLVRIVGRRPDYIERWLISAPPLIGRDQELSRLVSAWRGVHAGKESAALFIAGEAGMGKSALASTVRRVAAGEAALSARVVCTPESRARIAAPVSDLLNRLWFRAGETSAPGLGHFSSGETGGARSAVEALLAIAERRPLAIVVEDVHWADEATIEFLAQLSARAPHSPGLLLVLTGRTQPGRLTGTGIEVITLGPLAGHEVLAIVDRAGLGELGPARRHELIACAKGNPLVALELARALPTAGPLDDATRMQDGRPLRTGRLAEILAMRLDVLGPRKALAQAAAVCGNYISAGVLANMLSLDAHWLEPQLAELEAAGVLSEHIGRRGRWFCFTHVLLREAAYGSIVHGRRCELHRLAATALAARADADRLVEPAEVAAHFDAADRPDEAYAWWRRAGMRAAADAQMQTAVVHLRQALAAIRKPARARPLAEIETLRQLGVALIQARGSAEPEVRATYEQGLVLAQSQEVPGELRFDLLWGLDAFLLAGGMVTEAMSVGEQLLATARQLEGRQRLMLAQRMHAVANLLAGQVGEAIALYTEALALYDERADTRLRFDWASDQGVVAHAHLAWALSIAGDHAGAQRHSRLGLELAGRIGHPHSSAHALGVLATAAQIRGERGMAGAYAEAGRALAVHNDFSYWTAWCEIVRGWVSGGPAPEHGLRSISQAIDNYRATGAGQALPYAFMLMADALLRRDEPQRALEAIAQARATAHGGISLWDSELYRLEALSQRRLGAPRGLVERLLLSGEAVALEQGAVTFAHTCRAALAGGPAGVPVNPSAAGDPRR